MKKINRDGIRSLILETLEEMALDETKKEEVKEAEVPPIVDPEDETAAAGRGAREQDLSDEEVDSMNTTEIQKCKAAIDEAFQIYEESPSPTRAAFIITTMKEKLKYLESVYPAQTANKTQ